jgi:integrase
VRIDGADAFINRLGSWSDPAAIAKASALSARIWSDYYSGTFDKTLRTYQSSSNHQDKQLLEGLHDLALKNRQGRTIHAYRTLLKYGKTLRNRKDVDAFILWMQEQGLKNRTIVGILTEFRRVLPECKNLFSCSLKFQSTPRHTDVLSAEEIQAVLSDLQTNDAWFYPLFFLWISTGLRNGELRALTWDCIRWQERELLIHKSLRVDGLNSRNFIPAPTKTGQERVVPLTPKTIEILRNHQEQMDSFGLYTPDALVFQTPISHQNVYDTLLGKVWKRSLTRCGLRPRRLYAQRHTFISHALAMGNSPADLAQIAGHSTEMLLKTYAKPTGRLALPMWTVIDPSPSPKISSSKCLSANYVCS